MQTCVRLRPEQSRCAQTHRERNGGQHLPTVGGRWPDLSDLRIYVFLPLMLGYIFPKVNARKVNMHIHKQVCLPSKRDLFE